MNEPVIATFGLTRRFGKITAVDDLELAVPRGAVYGFLGPNGAGKTTTIRMLLGLIRPHAGEVDLFGQPFWQRGLGLLERVGSLVETPSLYPHLTGWENLEIVRRLRGGRRAQIERVLQIVRLQEDARRLVRHYSQGMRQRLGIAIALLSEPELLILDEPTNGLDPAGIHEMRDLICRLPEEQGLTVFLSSHLLNEIEQTATHIGIIQQGRLLFQGPLSELQARLEEHVSLGVEQQEEAGALLTRLGWTVQAPPATARNGHRRLVVTANGQSDAVIINQQLLEGGFKVYHLSLEQPSLEDIFLKLTQAQGI